MAGGSVTEPVRSGPDVQDMEPCPVGKGSPEWGKHRLQAVLGLEERWACRDCDQKIQWNAAMQARWAEWVRKTLADAAEVLGDA